MNKKPWYLQLNYLVVSVFMLVMPFLHGFGQKPLLVMALTFVALCMQLNRDTSIIHYTSPTGFKFYYLWAAWVFLTGPIVAENMFQFLDNAKMLLRTVVLIWSCFAIFSHQQNKTYFYCLLIAVALIQSFASIMGFSLDVNVGAIGGEIIRDVADFSSSRASGLTGNANALGIELLAGVWGSIMIWRNINGRTNIIMKLILLTTLAFFAYMILQSASRKTLLCFGVYIVMWFVWLLPGKFSIKSFMVMIVMGIILLFIGMYLTDYIMQETYMGKRFQELFDAGGGSATEGFKSNIRYLMYVDGWKMFCEHPITGVGLGQFAVHFFTGHYSHSDYMEPLACTGLVGFILYQGFALSIVIKIISLLKQRFDANTTYFLKGTLLFMISSHYFIGFGAPRWADINHIIILVFIGTYIWQIENIFIRRKPLYLS